MFCLFVSTANCSLQPGTGYVLSIVGTANCSLQPGTGYVLSIVGTANCSLQPGTGYDVTVSTLLLYSLAPPATSIIVYALSGTPSLVICLIIIIFLFIHCTISFYTTCTFI